MHTFKSICTVPATTRYNYVTKKNDVIVPAHQADVEITVAEQDIARIFGPKAAKNASRKSKGMNGCVTVKVTSPKHVSIGRVTDEHKWMSADDRAAMVKLTQGSAS